MPLAVVVSRLDDGNVIDVNPAFVALFGVSREALLGRTSVALGLVPEPSERAALVERIRRDGVAHVRGMRGRHKGGAELRFDAHLALVDDGGTPCVVSMLDDRTARADVDDRRWVATLGTYPVAVAIADAETRRFLEVNAAFERLTGYARADPVGHAPHGLGLFLEPAQREDVVTELELRGRVERPHLQIRTAAGEVRDLVVTSSATTVAGRAAYVTLAQDITELRRRDAESAPSSAGCGSRSSARRSGCCMRSPA